MARNRKPNNISKAKRRNQLIQRRMEKWQSQKGMNVWATVK